MNCKIEVYLWDDHPGAPSYRVMLTEATPETATEIAATAETALSTGDALRLSEPTRIAVFPANAVRFIRITTEEG